MKQYLYLLIFVFSGILSAYAQEPFTSYDGQTFKIGDVLILGNRYITSSKYGTLKEGYTNEYGRKQYDDLAEGELPFSRITIKEISSSSNTDIFSSGGPVFLVESDKLPSKKIYVNINKAIERGEVITKMIDKPLIDNASELTPELMFACCVRVNQLPINDNVILNYVAIIDKKLGQECVGNKFQFEKLKGEYKQRLEKVMAEFDFSKVYTIRVKHTKGDYDFQKKGYPLFYTTSKETEMTKHYMPSNGFDFLIGNVEKFKFLPVAVDVAEKYEKRSKGTDKFGYVSPQVYSVVYLTLQDKKMVIPKDTYGIINVENKYRHTIIGAEAKGMEVYDAPNCRYNLLGTIL